jgi:dUTPase
LFLKLSFVDYRGDGVIDADYKCPVIIDIMEIEDLDAIVRGVGGFGSTGV